MKLNPFEYEHLFSYSVDIVPNMEIMSPAPWGMRVTGYIAGGTVWGPKLNGKVLPAGADWSVVTPDGVVHVDVRTTLEADDGARIYLQYKGIMDLGGPEGYENYKALNFPAKCQIQIQPVLETDSQKYEWMNRTCYFRIGRVDFTVNPVVVQYDIYAFRSLPDQK